MGRAQPGRVRGLIGWAWKVQGSLALVGGAILVGAALAGADPQAAWLLAAVATIVAMLHNVPSAALIGLQRWRAASVVGLVTGAISVAATIAVLAAGGGITGMFAVEAAVAAANLVWTSWLARRALADVSGTIEPPGALRREVTRFAAIRSVGVVLTFVVWRRSELFFLERYSTDTEIALYSIPFGMVAALGMIPLALSGVLGTALATLYGGRGDRPHPLGLRARAAPDRAHEPAADRRGVVPRPAPSPPRVRRRVRGSGACAADTAARLPARRRDVCERGAPHRARPHRRAARPGGVGRRAQPGPGRSC